VADALADNVHYIHLDGVTSLSPEAAKALAKNKGLRYLNSLGAISDEVAMALSEYEGTSLELWGLRTLSAGAGAALRANGKISFPQENNQK
jgi:hypothetical protein